MTPFTMQTGLPYSFKRYTISGSATASSLEIKDSVSNRICYVNDVNVIGTGKVVSTIRFSCGAGAVFNNWLIKLMFSQSAAALPWEQ